MTRSYTHLLTVFLALSCGAACKRRGSAGDDPPGAPAPPPGPPPAPRFFPRITADQWPSWLPGLRLGDSTVNDVRAALHVELTPAPPAPRTAPFWTANAAPAVTLYNASIGPTLLVLRFAPLPNRAEPVLIGLLATHRADVQPPLCDTFARFRAESGHRMPIELPTPTDLGDVATTSYGVGGDATGQLHAVVHCGTYTMAAGGVSIPFAQLRVEVALLGVPPNLPSPMPALPPNFVDPPDPAAAPPTAAAAPAPAAAADGPAGPEEPGIVNIPGTWYCTAGTHTFANLALAGRTVGVAGQCRMTLTGCTLSRADTVVRVSGEGSLTMNNCRVESTGAGSPGVTVSESGQLAMTGGEIRARVDGLFAFGEARATLEQVQVNAGPTSHALNFSGRARATVRGSTLNRPNLTAGRARVTDGGGNTGFAAQ
jgi:hypothetical protein